MARRKMNAGELAALVKSTATSSLAAIKQATARAVERTTGAQTGLDGVVHDRDLVMPGDLDTAKRRLALLVVRGDLTVDGCFADSLNPESVVIVTGNLRARRLVSTGYLEVHGDVIVEEEAVFFGNESCAAIGGDLRAAFVLSQQHTLDLGGRVHAPLVIGDATHIRSPHDFDVVKDTDERLIGLLVRDLLDVVDDNGEPALHGTHVLELARRVRAGRSVRLPAASKPMVKPAAAKASASPKMIAQATIAKQPVVVMAPALAKQPPLFKQAAAVHEVAPAKETAALKKAAAPPKAAPQKKAAAKKKPKG